VNSTHNLPTKIDSLRLTWTRKVHLRALFLGLFCLLFAPGFVCATRVERLEGEVDALRLQFEEIQQRINNDQSKMSEMILRADEEMAQLEELQRRANEMLTRNNVDLSLQLEAQTQEIATLRGSLEAQKMSVEKLQKEVQAVVSGLGNVGGAAVIKLPSDKEELFTFSNDAHAAGNWAEARAGLDEFSTKYPGDSRLDEVLYKLADACYQLGDYTATIGTVRSLLKNFSKSTKVNPGIWLMGEAAAAVGDCDTATVAFEALQGTTTHGKEAKQKLKLLKTQCR